MKKLIYVLLLVVVAGSSCKKDNINSAEDLVKKLQKGVWQLDRANDNGTIKAAENFTAFKFSANTVSVYATRTEMVGTIYYRIKKVENVYRFYTYQNKTEFDEDRDSAGSWSTLSYKDNEFAINSDVVFKYYSSMDKTKDLPRGGFM